jgi:hypothetical protein
MYAINIGIALPLFPRAAIFVHVNQLYALLLHENACGIAIHPFSSG